MALAGVLAGISLGGEAPVQDKPIKVPQAAAEIDAGVQLLDVRTKEEWDAGHLKGAKRVTLSEEDFVTRVRAIFDAGKPVVVYCRSGKRSAQAVKQLHGAGFTSVHDMAGGIIAWEKEGKPVVK